MKTQTTTADEGRLTHELLERYEGVFVICMQLPGAGFGACVLATLNQLRYAERHNYLPIVHRDHGAESSFCDPDHVGGMWDQYFEPVSPLSYEACEALVRDPDHPLTENHIHRLTQAEALEVNEASDDSIYSWTYSNWRVEQPPDLEKWYEEQRVKGRAVVKKYVRAKSHIQKKVDVFYDEHLGGHYVLGVHIRGTDFHYAPPVSPAEYFDSVERFKSEHPDLRLFLATDQVQYLDAMRKRFGDSVHTYDCVRSTDSTAPFHMDSVSPYRKGEDVLIDILLLSRANHLIRGASNVGEMAMYFGEQLTCTDLSLHKTKAFGQDYGKDWDFDASRPAWDVVGKTDLDSVAIHAESQSARHRYAYGLRRVFARIIKRPVRALYQRLRGRRHPAAFE